MQVARAMRHLREYDEPLQRYQYLVRPCSCHSFAHLLATCTALSYTPVLQPQRSSPPTRQQPVGSRSDG
jgi:hypothetical protein